MKYAMAVVVALRATTIFRLLGPYAVFRSLSGNHMQWFVTNNGSADGVTMAVH